MAPKTVIDFYSWLT